MTTPVLTPELRKLAANAIRALAIDATNAAHSGHPGAPMGLADIAVVLWAEVMRYDPNEPTWANRDRFVLSNGHASMLLYAMLHLTGYALPLEELKRFRQLGSKTPGHPEYGLAPGVETTTGPLGQGFANAVGMALGARMARARWNGRGFDPIDHHVFGILGDGCMMEGITGEAASLAGHLGLGELVFLYDDNGITIDGKTELTFSEDVEKRFTAYGWHVLRTDGHDQAAVKSAIDAGKAEKAKPTLIIARTHIGYGSPNKQDTAAAHGEPLGDDEAKLAKQRLGWTHGAFEIPAEVLALFRAAGEKGHAHRILWDHAMAEWRQKNPDLATRWDAHWQKDAPEDYWADALLAVEKDKGATRAFSSKVMSELARKVPALVGGSADLASSNKTTLKGTAAVSRETAEGRNIHFGIREHAMAAMVNGLALYGPFIPYGATFLTFSDYMRPSVRLAALMKVRSLFVYTHDSIYLGEDGPTHQSIEHLWALRLIPGLTVWRPADGWETAMAWAYAVKQGPEGPHALCFTRQNVEQLPVPSGTDPRIVWRGGYVRADRSGATVAIIGTGSEVGVAYRAAEKLADLGIVARVVSMPSVERFLAQDPGYRTAVLPPGMKRVSIEAGRTPPWRALVGLEGLTIGIDGFGESAPAKDLEKHFHLDVESVTKQIAAWAKG